MRIMAEEQASRTSITVLIVGSTELVRAPWVHLSVVLIITFPILRFQNDSPGIRVPAPDTFVRLVWVSLSSPLSWRRVEFHSNGSAVFDVSVLDNIGS